MAAEELLITGPRGGYRGFGTVPFSVEFEQLCDVVY